MKFDDILLQYCNAVYNQNTIDRWINDYILPFHKKVDLGIAKNYRNMTITSIEVKIYNVLLLNCIEPEIEKILRKNQNCFRRNRFTSQISTICRILEGVRAKNHEVKLLLVDFFKTFDSIHYGEMEQILLAYCLTKETIAAIMMLYKKKKVKDGDRIL